MVTIDWIKREYPLHYLVWNDTHTELAEELTKNVHDIERKDNRGRTPLMLAVMLGHVESVKTLLAAGADASHETSDGWTVVQEAVATGDPELVRLVLERRDYQRYTSRMAGIPELLNKLNQAPDFYVEMRWEFTSWLPLVSRMCPSDTYKVYKQGANVRIDTTLLGFDQSSWQRGSRSYVFRGAADGATVMEIDHDARHVYVERMRVAPPDEVRGALAPTTRDSVAHRLAAPIVTTYVDTDKISFERNKAGVWGWRSDKSESVAGHDCKVFSASNVELVTKTRTEHLAAAEKSRPRPARTPLHSFLGMAETVADVDPDQEQAISPAHTPSPSPSPHPPHHDGNPWELTAEEYFGTNNTSGQMRDIGRPREINTKVQKFRATLWLCERYPLSLQEQIMPVVDLMAISSSHFAKLKDFIQMQLPAGFPVKIEIPLFHVLNARITFGNIFALDTPVPHVFTIKEEVPTTEGTLEERITCVVDDGCFEPPPGYARPTDGLEPRRQFSVEEEDELLQFAIQQSLVEAGTERDEVDIWEALKAQRPSRPNTPGSTLAGEEERQLQRAIQASLALYRRADGLNADESALVATTDAHEDEEDPDLRMALMLSEQQRREDEEQRMHEQRVLEEILRLSLTDK